MVKTLIGPRLRQLRNAQGLTQAQMAKQLGISAAYVNLLENNQRSLSVQVLMALTETFGVDWRDLVADNDINQLADLRAAVQDPIFPGDTPDLTELRGAIDHAPRLVALFLALHQSHRTTLEKFRAIASGGIITDLLARSPETAIHDFFRDRENHFPALENAAEAISGRRDWGGDDIYGLLRSRLSDRHGVSVAIQPVDEMPDALRVFDRDGGILSLSQALNHSNRLFQMAHVLGLLECADILDDLIANSGVPEEDGRARCRVELTNYFAAALLLPYKRFLALAEASSYDIDTLASAFTVSFEQVCHRLTTLQRDGARGVPFFFLRVDKAGNVTKRFNATSFNLAEQGGACPVWNVHTAFRSPGVIVPQFVELPDGEQFLTISRTTDRPVFSRQTQDRRLVVTLGCEIRHVDRIGYAEAYDLSNPALFAPIGINCHLCPRQACSQRAHQPLHMKLPIDTDRRGNTRYES